MKIKKILVSQPTPPEKSPYFDIARKYNVEMVFRPFIKVEGLTAKEFRQSKINLADYTAVVFRARTAVDNFFRLCEENRVPIPDTLKYFCTTEAIALYLQKYIVYRKRKIFFGTSGKLNDPQLMAAITKHNKEKFLVPVSSVHKDDDREIEALKVDFTTAVMYRTVSNDFEPGEAFDYDMLIFFSPAGIDSLLKNFPGFPEKHPEVRIACFGASTTQAAKDAGLRVDIEAPSKETPSMTAALEKYLKENNR